MFHVEHQGFIFSSILLTFDANFNTMAGIYLHIPYCKTRCPYCDFFTQTDHSSLDRYTGTLLREMELRSDYLDGESIQTIYFGGGTPSRLSPDMLDKILSRIFEGYLVIDNPEITLECNPDDVDRDYLKKLRDTGINRLSLGTQSFSDQELFFLGRRHDASQNHSTLEQALAAGFENISIDLIYGLPGSTPEAWQQNLDQAFAYPIKHLSAYHLTIEPDTPFGDKKEKGELQELDEATSLRQFEMLIDHARRHGMEHYELSNFALPGYRSRHNSSYWRQQPYLGLGPSAHSYNLRCRHWNISNLKLYMDSVLEGKPVVEEEVLDVKDHFNEQIMTGLRTREGIDLESIVEHFGDSYRQYLLDASESFIETGRMVQDGQRLKLSENGKFIADSILTQLIWVED